MVVLETVVTYLCGTPDTNPPGCLRNSAGNLKKKKTLIHVYVLRQPHLNEDHIVMNVLLSSAFQFSAYMIIMHVHCMYTV